MAKLYFKYGAMGSSKSAQALIAKFNYEERQMTVWLIKPAADRRDGTDIISSRIGMQQKAEVILPETDLLERFREMDPGAIDVIISDESQFFTARQIEQLRDIVDLYDVPVLCFGLRTDFLAHVFPGSLRLFELADSLTEIKTICACGQKAIVSARIGQDGRVITSGDQVFLGGNDSYLAMCHTCWKKRIRSEATRDSQ
jgi:thymidine kinase